MAEEPSNSPTKQQQQQQKQEIQEEEAKAARDPPTSKATTRKALTFWAYLTISISILTLLLSPLLSSSPSDPRSWFLSLPDDLRLHHSKGKLIKLHPHPLQLFAIDHGPKHGDAVLFVHGLASSSYSFRQVLPALGKSGLRAVALDLPGSGFSDAIPSDHGFSLLASPFRWIFDVYSEIVEKGIFWGFDQLVESGGIPYDQIRVTNNGEGGGGGVELGYGSVEIARVLEQVVDSLGLAPVHLVLHDSAMEAGMNFVAASGGLVRGVTLIDSAAGLPAFPSLVLGVPLVGSLVVRSRVMFSGLLRLCCSRYMDGATAEAHRLLVKGEEGRRAVVAAGKALNSSFDLGEWVRSEVARDIPVQILWSNTWSDRWIDEGKRAASQLPMANFSHHSGGRWPQVTFSQLVSFYFFELYV